MHKFNSLNSLLLLLYYWYPTLIDSTPWCNRARGEFATQWTQTPRDHHTAKKKKKNKQNKNKNKKTNKKKQKKKKKKKKKNA